MADIIQILLYSLASGVTVILGGFLAKLKVLPNNELGREISHSVIAFGGGVLVAAVAFVLAPKGIQMLSLPVLAFTFFLGVVCFLFLDRFIAQHGGRAAQLMAMLLDFIPEAIALGAIFSSDKQTGLLLALFIGMQNLPEAYNSFGDLHRSGFSPNRALLVLIPFSMVVVAAADGVFVWRHTLSSVSRYSTNGQTEEPLDSGDGRNPWLYVGNDRREALEPPSLDD
jgi:ZIP family zinc transporter